MAVVHNPTVQVVEMIEDLGGQTYWLMRSRKEGVG